MYYILFTILILTLFVIQFHILQILHSFKTLKFIFYLCLIILLFNIRKSVLIIFICAAFIGSRLLFLFIITKIVIVQIIICITIRFSSIISINFIFITICFTIFFLFIIFIYIFFRVTLIFTVNFPIYVQIFIKIVIL